MRDSCKKKFNLKLEVVVVILEVIDMGIAMVLVIEVTKTDSFLLKPYFLIYYHIAVTFVKGLL